MKRCLRFLCAVFLVAPALFFAQGGGKDPSLRYFYDADHVRYELRATNGNKPYNWLILPGGPGSDSSYLRGLIDLLDLPGNVWLIDLPGSGTNTDGTSFQDFDKWFELFPSIIEKFENPILVGHSFGGMFPFLFPEIEKKLKGFVSLHSSPALWAGEALDYGKQFDLPSFDKEIEAFAVDPSQKTFDAALEACMPYYFPQESLAAGRDLFAETSIRYQPALWWMKKAEELPYSAKWIPQRIPTLIIGGKYDCMCPFILFEKDERFHRENIELLLIKNGGHCSWIENPEAFKKAFKEFCSRLH